MAKLFGYDATMQDAISKITAPKMAKVSDVVSSKAAYLTGSGSSISLAEDVIIAVGPSVFKSAAKTLTVSDNDGTFSAFAVGKDYCIYACDPTDGDETDLTAEVYLISLNTTYPNGYTADNSRKIGGFHYGVVRAVNTAGIPVNSSNVAEGSGWEDNVSNGILPNSVWTLLNRPTCDPTGMVKIGTFWADIYLASDNGNSGLKSAYGVNPITGTEGLNWYIANEKLQRVGKRLPSYAEFCQLAYGSPEGKDGNNDYAWSKTSNTGRTTTGAVTKAVSAKNVRDAVGNVWEWVDELCLDPTASSWNWYDVLGAGYGDAYIPSNTALHALSCGGDWRSGVRAGSRAVNCDNAPWYVSSYFGVRGACDSL